MGRSYLGFNCCNHVEQSHQVLCLLLPIVLGDEDYQDTDYEASEQLDDQAENHPLSHSHVQFGRASALPSLQPALAAGALVEPAAVVVGAPVGVVNHGHVGHHSVVNHGHGHSAGGHAGHDLFVVSDGGGGGGGGANGNGGGANSGGGGGGGACTISYELACANGAGQSGDGKSILDCPAGEEEVCHNN